MWDKLTEDFPKGLYYLDCKYLYKDTVRDVHYCYVNYKLESGKRVNIILQLTLKDRFKGGWSYDYLMTFPLSYAKRYYDLIDYRYVDSFRKSSHAI